MYTVQSTVKTSFSRPLSKPRVRNPLSSLMPPNQCQTSNSSSIPSIGSSNSQTENAMQVEQDFLASGGNSDTSWADNSFDEEYFSIPEDNTLLNSSLSSSLSSLCNQKDLEGDVDKFKHIRKEAASRKAQILSTATSATNSPESRRHSAGSFGLGSSNMLAEPESTPKKM